MEIKQKDNSSRHVSVLGEVVKTQPPKTRHTKTVAWLLFILWLFIAVTRDSSVFFLSIPEFNELQMHEGKIEIVKGGKRNSYLALDTGDEVVVFTCWITSSGISDCIKHEQRPLYVGRRGRVHSYRALIDGGFRENRLLQLEVEGEQVITYAEQKAEYLRLQNVHPYFHTLSFIPVSVFILLFYFINTQNKQTRRISHE